MGKAKALSSEEWEKITAFKECDLSNCEIMCWLKRNSTVIDNFVKFDQNYNSKKSTGLQANCIILTDIDKRTILRVASYSVLSDEVLSINVM